MLYINYSTDQFSGGISTERDWEDQEGIRREIYAMIKTRNEKGVLQGYALVPWDRWNGRRRYNVGSNINPNGFYEDPRLCIVEVMEEWHAHQCGLPRGDDNLCHIHRRKRDRGGQLTIPKEQR